MKQAGAKRQISIAVEGARRAKRKDRSLWVADGSSPVEQEACELSLERKVDLRLGCEKHFWQHRTEG